MTQVSKICTRAVDLIDENDSVRSAAQRMLQRNVGSLIVQDPAGKPVGIVTDRDLTIQALAHGLDAETTKVHEVMSDMPMTILETADVWSALQVMAGECCRRVPVVDVEDRLTGILSLDDVLVQHARDASLIGRLLERESPNAVETST